MTVAIGFWVVPTVARDYVAADLDWLREAYRGYETAGRVPDGAAVMIDQHQFDASSAYRSRRRLKHGAR